MSHVRRVQERQLMMLDLQLDLAREMLSLYREKIERFEKERAELVEQMKEDDQCS